MMVIGMAVPQFEIIIITPRAVAPSAIRSWRIRRTGMRNTNIFNIPLAFLRYDVQYLSLGPKWYIVKVARQDNMLVIAAIEVMEQYPSSNTALKNSCNRKLGLNEKFKYRTEELLQQKTGA